MENIKSVYDECIAEYLTKRKSDCSHDSVVRYVNEQPDIALAIYTAVKSRDKSGKMHSHQRHVRREAFERFLAALVTVKEKIEETTSFNDLFSIIQTEGGRVYGVGEMLVYDTAFRIGQWLKIYPDRVYLHRGSRIGVERFMGRRIHNGFILKKNLKPPFDNCPLECWQLEDLFCIYKDIFINGDNRKKGKQCFC